jgi:hypothetical protein
MMNRVKDKVLPALGPAVFLMAAVISFSTCKAKETASGKEGLGAEKLTLEEVQAIMGKSEPRHSGVFDIYESDNEYFIIYHFYTTEVEDIDDDIGIELAPKVRALYAKVKHLDRVIFDVDVWREGQDPIWTNYCHFLMTRQVFEKTEWTSVLDKDFFKIVLDLNYSELLGNPRH